MADYAALIRPTAASAAGHVASRGCAGGYRGGAKTMLRVSIMLIGLCMVGAANAMQNEELFRRCLRGSDNPQAIRASKQACTEYLSRLMADVRFGIVTDKERAVPFCLPSRELTDQETNLLFARIKADIRGMIRDGMDDIIAGVVITKAYRCNQ